MSELRIEIPNCNRCPFHAESYDDFALEEPEVHWCNLMKHLYYMENLTNPKYQDYFLDHKKRKVKTPKHCPIGQAIITLK